jgi:hypothetical protein
MNAITDSEDDSDELEERAINIGRPDHLDYEERIDLA